MRRDYLPDEIFHFCHPLFGDLYSSSGRGFQIYYKLPWIGPGEISKTQRRQKRKTQTDNSSSSEKLLYALMFILPLVGWGMLSPGHYPIVMLGSVHLPPILPANPMLYALLRQAHTVLAFLLFATFLTYLSAVLFHTLIIRDRLLDRMAIWPTRQRKKVKGNGV